MYLQFYAFEHFRTMIKENIIRVVDYNVLATPCSATRSKTTVKGVQSDSKDTTPRKGSKHYSVTPLMIYFSVHKAL